MSFYVGEPMVSLGNGESEKAVKLFKQYSCEEDSWRDKGYGSRNNRARCKVSYWNSYPMKVSDYAMDVRKAVDMTKQWKDSDGKKVSKDELAKRIVEEQFDSDEACAKILEEYKKLPSQFKEMDEEYRWDKKCDYL